MSRFLTAVLQFNPCATRFPQLQALGPKLGGVGESFWRGDFSSVFSRRTDYMTHHTNVKCKWRGQDCSWSLRLEEYLITWNEFKSPGPDELHPRVLKKGGYFPPLVLTTDLHLPIPGTLRSSQWNCNKYRQSR